MPPRVHLKTPKLVVTAEHTKDAIVVKAKGSIDESAEFPKLLAAIQGLGKPAAIRFDLGGVTYINSCGVRDWIIFLEKISADARVEFDDLSVVLAEQASLVPNFLGRADTRVLSFQIPYYCSACDQPSVRTATLDEFNKSRRKFLRPA